MGYRNTRNIWKAWIWSRIRVDYFLQGLASFIVPHVWIGVVLDTFAVHALVMELLV